MILFLLIFFLFSFLTTIFNLSMLEKKRQKLIAFALVFLFCWGTYPFAIHQTNQTFNQVIKNPQLISSVAVVQIIESILLVVLAFNRIGGRFKQQSKWGLNLLTILPSMVFLGGLFFLQIAAFLTIGNTSFEAIATIFSLVILFLVLIFTTGIRQFIPSWEVRTELKIMLSFLQIIFAMFLPLIVNEIKVPYTNLVIEYRSIIVLFSALIFFFFLGLIQNKIICFFKHTKQTQ